MQNLADVQRIARFVHNLHSMIQASRNIHYCPKKGIRKGKRGPGGGGGAVFAAYAPTETLPEDFQHICEAIKEIKSKVKIEVNVSLGFMTLSRARELKNEGVKRYSTHNLEAAKLYFGKICNTP